MMIINFNRELNVQLTNKYQANEDKYQKDYRCTSKN